MNRKDLVTRGYTFRSSFECEGGSHVKHMHTILLLIHPVFSSKFMVTWLILFDNPILIHFQSDRKFTFDPVRTNKSKMKFRAIYSHVIIVTWLVRTGSKVNFRTVWKRIKSGFSNKLSQVIINFEKKFGGIKSESACIPFTWLPPSHTFLDQKLDPRVSNSEVWFRI